MIHSRISAIVLFCAAATGFAGAAAGQAQRPINSYIVQVAEGFEPAQVGRAIAQRTGGGLGHVYTRALRGFSIQLPPGLARQALERETGVLKVEIDIPVHVVAQTLPTGVRRIAADQNALAHATGGVNVNIAILDTGIDIDHLDLTIVGGTHFYTVVLLGIFPVGYQDNNYNDDNGHGTHCAGIAAALDNDTGVVGVAPGARLWAVKVLDASGSGYVSDLIAGIDWVAANPSIKVASMSLAATGRVDQLQTAIQNCVSKGIVFVAAAGNEHKDVYGADGVFPSADDTIPAAYPEVAAISALADSDGTHGGTGAATSYGLDDSFATFSNYSRTVVAGNPVRSPGLAIDLLMPGVNILSCWPGGYQTASGTSMATPHAAGLAALYIAEHGAASSASGVYAIRQALIDGGKDQASGLRLAAPGTEVDGAPENLGWAGPVQTDPVTDIAITSVSAPSITVQGDAVSIDVVVRNVGNQGVGEFSVTLDDTTTGANIGSKPVAALAAGGSQTLTFSWNTAGVSLGKHELTARHNFDDGDNSGNNSATTSIEIKAAMTDIAITSVEAPASAVLGSAVNIAVTVSNIGNRGVSTDILVTLTDAIGGQTATIGERTITGGLAAGGSTTLTFAWNTAGGATGGHTLTASHHTSDDDGTNNTRSTTVQITEQSTRPVVTVTTDVGPWITLRRGQWKAEATVVVQDADGMPVLYTTITGRWTGMYQATVTGSTDNSGLELFVTKALTAPGTVTFEVTRILDSEGRECELRGTLSDSYTKP
ncbi:MAG: S8 family serine peptidase [Planctomycetes bacterium]|nr:S8 family serine peptidase [Planctomycetota bacterium]